MTEELGRIAVRERAGSERFKDGDRDLGFDLLGFWRWSTSDLVSNTTRGVLAEYLVAQALGIGNGGVRDGWAAYDLKTKSEITVEVKSAAYLQSWHQTTLNPLDLSQWKFFVLPTKAIDARTQSQHSITLASLKTLSGGSVSYDELAMAVDAAAIGPAPSPKEPA